MFPVLKKKYIKLKKKQLEELWNEGMDIFGLSLFDKNKYEYVSEGSRYVNGKNCVAVRFISKVDRKESNKGIITLYINSRNSRVILVCC